MSYNPYYGLSQSAAGDWFDLTNPNNKCDPEGAGVCYRPDGSVYPLPADQQASGGCSSLPSDNPKGPSSGYPCWPAFCQWLSARCRQTGGNPFGGGGGNGGAYCGYGGSNGFGSGYGGYGAGYGSGFGGGYGGGCGYGGGFGGGYGGGFGGGYGGEYGGGRFGSYCSPSRPPLGPSGCPCLDCPGLREQLDRIEMRIDAVLQYSMANRSKTKDM